MTTTPIRRRMSIFALILTGIAAPTIVSCDGDEPQPNPTTTVTVTVTPFQTSHSDPAIPESTISKPTSANRVNAREDVEGMVSGLSEDRKLWLLVRPRETQQYWPQPGPLKTEPDGTFSGTAAFGEEGANTNDVFTLFLISMPKNQQLETSTKLEDLPDSATTLTSVEDLIRE